MEQRPRYIQLIENIEQQFNTSACRIEYYHKPSFKESADYETLINLSESEKVEAVMYLATCVNTFHSIANPRQQTPVDVKTYYIHYHLLYELMCTPIEFPPDFLLWTLFKACQGRSDPFKASWKGGVDSRPFCALVTQLEKHIEKQGLYDHLKKDIQRILEVRVIFTYVTMMYGSKDCRESVKKLQTFWLADNAEAILPHPLGDDIFGMLVSDDLKLLSSDQQSQWHALFHHLLTATVGKPSKKFLTKADQQIEVIGGAELFRAKVLEWLTAVTDKDDCYYLDEHSYLLKGLLWAMHRFHDQHTLQVIAQFTESSFQKASRIGSVAAGVGNAGLYILANTTGLEGVSHLSRLKLRVRHKGAQTQIQKYLDEQAQKRNLKSAQIEEIAVSDYGLVEGARTEVFDDYQLVLRLTGVGTTELQWLKADGSLQKSVPTFVKSNKELAAKLKKMQDLAKQIKQASSTQRDRIDRLYTENLSWILADFETYYLHHGLVNIIARKLIWSLDGQAALFINGQWQNETGTPVETNAQTKVHLWHPIEAKLETVLVWRDRLDALQIQQPFKQAYREIYLLTDAEINTHNYSNRMAAHILKQHQFNALAALRGWKYTLLSVHDVGGDRSAAKKRLPEFGLTAQFWLNELLDTGDNISASGIWNYVATDQVRFCDNDNQAVSLQNISPLIFSEILRDVDLFVGVASVGNDPQWQNGGETGLQNRRDYWQRYSFGDLTEIAKTRKSVLERLLPRLKIRDVAKIEGKFLIIQGKKHAYKIHIGSGNILIAPNDRYLCIIPSHDKNKAVDSLFLPFEGDGGLSIVLSKAFLLVNDDKITDPTILSQL